MRLPTWSHDEKSIDYVRVFDKRGVYRVRLSDRKVEKVIDLSDFRFAGATGLWMGLDRQDTPMLLRDVGTNDLYALKLEKK